MADLYEGKLPPQYDKFFPSGEPKQVVNLVKLAWTDLAVQIGRVPELRAEVFNASNAEMQRAGLLERIGFNYLRNSKPSGKILMHQLAWWLIGGGRSVMVVQPDAEKQIPIFTSRDPRTAYPNPKEVYGNQITELQDIIFKYTLPVRVMDNMGLATKEGTDSVRFPRTDTSEQREGTVIEFIDDELWIIASDGGTVNIVEHNLGLVPAFVFQTFSPNKPYGLSQFQDQVNFMVSISRLLTQKMAFNDRVVWPITWVKGHEGKLKIGPHVINKLGPQGEMGQIAPTQQIQVDRDIEQMTQFSRILNRNPEVRQGEIQSKGQYTSAKTLEQLAEAIDTVIGVHWDILSVGMKYGYKVAYKMDQKLWGGKKKTARGTMRGQKFRDEYTPNKDINGRWEIEVEYGFGVGGYQGFLQQLQAMEAKTQSRRGAMEQMPGIHDVGAKMREIELEMMDDAGQAAFAALAANGTLDPILWAKIRKEMAKKGMPLNEAVLKYEKELQARTDASLQAGASPEALTASPTEQGIPPAEAPLPGLPPQQLV